MERQSIVPLHPVAAPDEQAFWSRVISASHAPRTPVAAVLRAPWRWLNTQHPSVQPWSATVIPFRSRGRTPALIQPNHAKDDRCV